MAEMESRRDRSILTQCSKQKNVYGPKDFKPAVDSFLFIVFGLKML